MITRIEIDGFKTFQNFAVDLAPFQVIIGANGCGKSNFFDALHFLSRLASEELDAAFQGVRKQSHELFTILPNGERAYKMRFSVEMLTQFIVWDYWGEQINLTSPRLRYVLEVGREIDKNGVPHVHIIGEWLEPIPQSEDRWTGKYAGEEFANYLYSTNHILPIFINTSLDKVSGDPTVYLTPERSNPEPHSSRVGFQVGKLKRTLLSRVDTIDYAHALAARREMQQWRFLFLNPDALRLPNSTTENGYIFKGDNLASVLAQRKAEYPSMLRDVSRDVTNLVSSIKNVDVEYNPTRDTYEIFANTKDERRFYMPNLSDGTVRLLALSILKNDPQNQGVLCLEEPENGIHPGSLKRLVQMLRKASTNFSSPKDGLDIKQLLITTHSPELVSHLDVTAGELLFATMATRVGREQEPLLVTRMSPVRVDEEKNTPEGAYALTNVIAYLNGSGVEAANKKLRAAHLK